MQGIGKTHHTFAGIENFYFCRDAVKRDVVSVHEICNNKVVLSFT